MFAANATNNLTDLTTLEIPDASLITRVQGTNGGYVYHMIFKKMGGTELYRIEQKNSTTLGDDQILQKGEQIIGFYGGYDQP